jgi:hypothetical protein
MPPVILGAPRLKYSLSLSASGKYVVCRVLKPVSTEIALEFGKATVDFARQHDLQRKLFDVRGVRNIQTVARNYDFAYKDMARLELDPSDRSAILVDPADRSHDFVQIAMRNAGYDVRIFVDEQQAIAWLEEDS